MIRPDRTTAPPIRPQDLDALGLLPKRISAEELAEATCRGCLGRVWIHAETGSTLDLDEFRGMKLLALHPCAHVLGPDELDDPDWGWVG